MLIIYAERIGPRLIYTCKIIFEVVCPNEYRLTDDQNEFNDHEGPKMSYGSALDSELNIKAQGLLVEGDLQEIDLQKTEYRDFPVIFRQGTGGLLPFDVFAAVFFAVSRYEEYLPFNADELGRFSPENSFAFKYGILSKAYVHRWVHCLIDALNKIYPNALTKNTKVSIEASFDIDNAFAYRHKNFFRTSAALIRSMPRPKEFIERLFVLLGKKQDPYDNYEFIQQTCKKVGFRPNIFVLCAPYGKYDKNISPGSRHFKTLIENLSTWSKVGIHPSFASNQRKSLAKEKDTLENSLGEKVQHSRQHFLMLRMPDTYQNLINVGITSDHSMGYSEMPGFRAGISLPYPFYNLKKEGETNLMIHPFSFMDTTYIHHLSQANALEVLKVQWKEVQETGGSLHTVWHNEYFGGETGVRFSEYLNIVLSGFGQ